MGVIDLDCIAANPNSTALYAIANVEDTRGDLDAIILRSNDNPTNATDIKWQYLSFVPEGTGPDIHYKYPRFGNVDCAVSSSEQFTAFFYNPVFSVTGRSRLSFYIEKDGVETAVHAVMDEAASVIRFGLVEQSTGYLQLAAIWKLVDGRFMVGQLTDKIPNPPNPKTKTFKIGYSPMGSAPLSNTDQRHRVYRNGSLYMYSDTTGLISSFPFPNPLAAPIQKDIHQAVPIADNERNMFFQGSRQNSSYLGYLTRPPSDPTVSYTNMTMLLTTVDLINPTPNTTTIISTKTSTALMDSSGVYKDVSMFQAIGGHLPGQEPFAVGLTVDGYFGMTLGGQSMGSMIPFENGFSIIEGAQIQNFRSRFRNHNDQVVPGYKRPGTSNPGAESGAVIGFIFGLFAIVGIFRFSNRWLEKNRLASERRHAERNSYELIARLQHASEPHGGASGVGGGGAQFVSPPPSSSEFVAHQVSANTSAHTPLDGLGLTRHPRPNTVITIGDDGEPGPIPEDRHTQAS